MKAISHESDHGFQKIAIIMAAITVLCGILSFVGGTTGISMHQSSYVEMGIVGFVMINLLFSYTIGIMRYYLGTNWVENMYAAFLATGLLGFVLILFDVLYSLFSII